MDALLSNIMGEDIVRTESVPSSSEIVNAERAVASQVPDRQNGSDEPWKHFSFICSVELVEKLQAIAHKEGFTIRALMEYMMRQGIATYESKNGKVRKIKHKGVTDVM